MALRLMKGSYLPILLIWVWGLPCLGQLTPLQLTCEHRPNPIGIDVPRPRLSWQLSGTGRNLHQTAYEVEVSASPVFSAKSRIWVSGKQPSAYTLLIPYGGPALASGQRAYWRVRTWDGAGKQSRWSEPAFWEMGLLKPESDWRLARWVAAPADTNLKKAGPAAMLRKEFSVPKKIASARLYVTAHGLYAVFLNGKRVSQDLLTPGWTAYHRRLQYQVYDVAEQLRAGSNAVGVLLGDGWYRGSFLSSNQRGQYGNRTAVLAQLRLRFQDGSEQIIGTDSTWQTSMDGPIRSSEIYHGEHYDARKEQPGWASFGFTAPGWASAQVLDKPKNQLIATVSQPVRPMEEVKPIRIFRTPSGLWVADMGQNMTGFVRLKVMGAAGTTIRLCHAEVLDKNGEFYTANLRLARQQITYTLRGNGEEVYEPHFTFMGFRYVSVEGWPGELKPEHLTGVVTYTSMPPTGTFECSNPLVNRLQQNIQWSQKGNYVDVPTDCPQRDERLAWLGDAQAFGRTAGFNFDIAALFSRWLADLLAEQTPAGSIPFTVPNILQKTNPNRPDWGISTSAGWADAATILPWTLYRMYGDVGVLERHYPSMKAYVEYIRKKAGDTLIWRGGSVFGDWLFYRPSNRKNAEPNGYTHPDLVATAFFAYSTDLLRQTAEVLGKTDDANTYSHLLARIKHQFCREYLTPTGRLLSDSQTAYVLALQFGLLPDSLRATAARYLVADIRSRNNHVSTGILGSAYLCHVLAGNGYTDAAYDLLLQETYPSWLYPITRGATTIWERWDGIQLDSTFQDTNNNSFNHYAFGAIGDWLYRVVAGIEIGQPGYKQILIQPHPTHRLGFAKATLNSPYGEIRSGWERKNNRIHVQVRLPPNTTAIVRLPNASAAEVLESSKPLAQCPDIRLVGVSDYALTLAVGSGDYTFTYPAK